jgi:outer membrane protease
MATVTAGEYRPLTHPQPSMFSYEAGARYWYGWGKTAKDLYGTTTSQLVSRLTYDGLAIHSADAFMRADHTSGWFVKGYAGAGFIVGGRLEDEDFPPVTTPYSSTNSSMKDGSTGYASVDLGYKIVKGGDFNIGAFVGYHFLNQKVNAYGCSQIATFPSCVTPIPETIKVISQDNDWHSLRLGLDANVELSKRVKFSVEGAWLPYVSLGGADTHWLRIGVPGGFTGPVPEDGKGWGYQFEGVLSYKVNDFASFGVGGRYWHMQTTEGHTHFENHVVTGTGLAQELRWSVDHYGIFLQGSIAFGPYASEAY